MSKIAVVMLCLNAFRDLGAAVALFGTSGGWSRGRTNIQSAFLAWRWRNSSSAWITSSKLWSPWQPS